MKVPFVLCGGTIALRRKCGRNPGRMDRLIRHESFRALEETSMRPIAIIVAAVALAGTVGACADPYYGYRTRTYAYSSDYYYPGYYSSAPVHYSNGPYYASPY